MSNSPWTVQEDRRVYFGQVEVDTEEKTGSNGNVYWKISFVIAPLNGGELTERSYFSFGKDWNRIVLPSIKALFGDNPQMINGKWARYTWETWRDYSRNTVSYYEDSNPEKLQADEKGALFVEKYALKFEEAFDSEEEAISGSDAFYGVQNASNGKQNGQSNDDPKMPFIVHYAREARGDTGEVDREKLAQVLAGSPLGGEYDINHSVVQKAIQEVEAEDVVPF